jgi:methylated-DNA-[protein]-cysteine S-methyltransferase
MTRRNKWDRRYGEPGLAYGTEPQQQGRQYIVKQYCYYQSPIGKLLLIGKNGELEALHFPNAPEQQQLADDWQYDETAFQEALKQLAEYFSGKRQQFDLKLAPSGTAFQQRVWQELRKIPFGRTASYGEIAERIGNAKACRAVGMANSKNPIPIIVPCHRVIGKNGSLTGFGGGLEVKKQLLQLEEGV